LYLGWHIWDKYTSINFSATDNLSGVKSVVYEYKQNNNIDTFHLTNIDWDTSSLVLDSYILKATVTDNAGNSASATVSYTVGQGPSSGSGGGGGGSSITTFWTKGTYSISEEQFKQGRSTILKSFLKRQSVFLTDFFKEKYEAKAAGTADFALIPVTETAIKWADMIIVMNEEYDSHKTILLQKFPFLEKDKKPIIDFNIPDVYWKNEPELKEIIRRKLRQHLR